MPTPLLNHLFQAMDTVVLERLEADSYRVISPPPEWLTTLWPVASERQENVNPGDVFPFLENFLIDAESFWQTTPSGQIKSGIWSEVDDEGKEYHLEATAVSMDESRLLLIAFPKMDYQEKFHIIQRGREIHLEYARVLREIQKKEVLLHCIIHDLKGPLAVMNGVFGLIEESEISTAELQDLMKMGQDHVSRQERMIQDVLDAFSGDIDELETYAASPDKAPDVVACARTVIGGLVSAFARLDIRLGLDHDLDLEADWHVVGERDHLERIFSNLLENALRYSPSGTAVTVGCYRDGTDIVTYVDDEGPGIPESLQSRLFDKFVQGHRRTGSSGIGLFFCRITVERWGGKIGVETRPEGGSRFWFRLPQPG